jgi:hypothetical protein
VESGKNRIGVSLLLKYKNLSSKTDFYILSSLWEAAIAKSRKEINNNKIMSTI